MRVLPTLTVAVSGLAVGEVMASPFWYKFLSPSRLENSRRQTPNGEYPRTLSAMLSSYPTSIGIDVDMFADE
jgi:hypothetical protein